MRSITCTSCGKRYDYDADDFCPKCGSYNPPSVRQGRITASHPQLSRSQTTRSPQPGRTAPPRTPSARPAAAPIRTPAAGRRPGGSPSRPVFRPAWEEPPKQGRSPLVLGAVFLFIVVMGILGAALVAAFAGDGPSAPAPEPALEQPGPHEQFEDFSMHGWSVTVEDVWEPDLPDSTHIPEGRCVAIDLWISGGSRVSGASFATPYLVLDDGTLVYAVDADALLSRQLKNAGVYDVVPADAQWDDPLYGQLVFFLPQDAAGSVVLSLPAGAQDGEAPPLHLIPLELPWQESQSTEEAGT